MRFYLYTRSRIYVVLADVVLCLRRNTFAVRCADGERRLEVKKVRRNKGEVDEGNGEEGFLHVVRRRGVEPRYRRRAALGTVLMSCLS